MIRIAAAADIHCRHDSQGSFRPYFEQMCTESDVLLLGGDLTNWGYPNEAEVLAGELEGLPIPIVAVLGNHDYHNEQEDQVRQLLEDVGVRVMEQEACILEIAGQTLGVVGAKGFGGGFGKHCLTPFGEREIKAFVRATRTCSDSITRHLRDLHADHRVVLLHYSPVQGTLRGEPEAIYPYLGCSMLAEAVDAVGADLIVHGHAHAGSPQGTTPGGIPVRNVAVPVIRRPYVVFELEREAHAVSRSRNTPSGTTFAPRSPFA